MLMTDWLSPLQEYYLSLLVTGLLVLPAADLAQHRRKSGFPELPGIMTVSARLCEYLKLALQFIHLLRG